MSIMEKLVANIIYAYNIKHMYDDNKTRPGTCPVCHNTIEKIPDSMYKVPKKKGDMFYTYDGFCIVSERFKSFCDEREYPNLTFIALTKSVGFYFFMPQDIYELDYSRKEVEFINKRNCCGSYDEVIGSVPSYKAPDFSIDTNDFICRSKWAFGSYGQKNLLIIVGLDTVTAMKAYGLKGMYFENVYL